MHTMYVLYLGVYKWCRKALWALSSFYAFLFSSFFLTCWPQIPLNPDNSLFLFCVFVDYISQRTPCILTCFKQMSIWALKRICTFTRINTAHTLVGLEALLDPVTSLWSGCSSLEVPLLPPEASELWDVLTCDLSLVVPVSISVLVNNAEEALWPVAPFPSPFAPCTKMLTCTKSPLWV